MIWIYRYSDIIQESFYDTYLNLTLKSVMLLKWVSTHCSQVTFVLKTDDDMFVNIPALVEHLTQPDIRNRKDLILGSLFCRARPIKDQNSKWYSPQFMFSGKEYPDYVSGTGYIMSGHLVPILFESAMQVPLFHLEDIFITGNYDQSLISGRFTKLLNKIFWTVLQQRGLNLLQLLETPKWCLRVLGGGIISRTITALTLTCRFSKCSRKLLLGLVARRANVTPENFHLFSHLKQPLNNTCVYRKIITSHGLKPFEMKSIWTKVGSKIAPYFCFLFDWFE